MPEPMYKLAIVGLGHVASHHVAAIELSPHFQLVAGCDSNPDRLSLLGGAVRGYTDVNAMLTAADVDAVVIASPNRVHVRHGLAVLNAGKRVVMEKPLAETREEFSAFEQQLDKLNGRCSVALHAAFGREVEWFCKAWQETSLGGTEIASFVAGFYDPYFGEAGLCEEARSLGGSWMDSGINALSVLCRFIDPAELAMEDSRMTRVPGSGCREIQGTVDFRFPAARGPGRGSIETNWTLGRNRKVTTLLSACGRRLVLDHSKEQVVLQEGQQVRVLFSGANERPRLTNHYVGVFEDLALQMQSDRDNFDHSRRLHDLLYQAEEWLPAKPLRRCSAEETASL